MQYKKDNDNQQKLLFNMILFYFFKTAKKSTFCLLIYYHKLEKIRDFFLMVELRGIEPLSENKITEPSTSLVD